MEVLFLRNDKQVSTLWMTSWWAVASSVKGGQVLSANYGPDLVFDEWSSVRQDGGGHYLHHPTGGESAKFRDDHLPSSHLCTLKGAAVTVVPFSGPGMWLDGHHRLRRLSTKLLASLVFQNQTHKAGVCF